MAIKHKCIRDCHYLLRYWKAGEVLEETAGFEGAPPNKHFAPIGSPEAEAAGKEQIKTAGDDPRPTREMIRALRDYGVEVDDSTPRKEVFFKLVALEQAEARDAGKSKLSTSEPPVEAEDPMAGMILSEMTPDEIERFTAPQWRQCIKCRFGMDMPVRTSKPDLVDRAIEEELSRSAQSA